MHSLNPFWQLPRTIAVVICMHFRCTFIKEILESIYKNNITLLLHHSEWKKEKKSM